MPFTPRLVLVTVPSMEVARTLAKVVLEARLAACVNIVSSVESRYWWNDKLESAAEVLLMMKSSAEQFEKLRELIAVHHPYECPEVVAIAPKEIAPTYRQWWESQMPG